MTYVIAAPCRDVMDASCVDACPVDCIYTGETMLFINPDECIDCAACEPACPVEAIFPEQELPPEWAPYAKANADFFLDIGNPGSGTRTPRQPDPELPPRPPQEV